MVCSWVLVPVIAAFIGWLINRIVIRSLFRSIAANKQQMAAQIGKLASTELLSFNDMAANISRPENVQKVMPFVEEHIDHFLRVKLAEQMPMIGMFIGEKTIAQLKSVFISELESLFPAVMDRYLGQLSEELDLEGMITAKFGSFPAEKLEAMLRGGLAKEIRFFGLAGAISGLVIGIITVLLTQLMR
jgi:uncharacterized membrane protein YheB (UPF0754 family)